MRPIPTWTAWLDNQIRAIWFADAFTGTTWQQGDANYDGAVDRVGIAPLELARRSGRSSAAALPSEGVAPAPSPARCPVWSPDVGSVGLWLEEEEVAGC